MTSEYGYAETHFVRHLDEWLDANVSQVYKDQPLAQDWARVSKVIEELGEAIQCLIGWSGQNPRKGIYSSHHDMVNELCDVIITGVLAVQHFTKDEPTTYKYLHDRWDYRLRKAGL